MRSIILFVMAVVGANNCGANADLPEVEPPNIVVILVDDMGVMDTSVPFLAEGQGQAKRYPLNELYRTPNMERLAERGIRFSNFYAMSVCSPSRVSLMTGQNAARHRTTNWINPGGNNRGRSGPPKWNWRGLDSQSVTLPRLLQSVGYRTIHIGKGHFGPRGSEGADPRSLGFEINIGGSAEGQPGSYYGAENYARGPSKNGKRIAKRSVPHLDKYHGSDTFLTEALTLEANSLVTGAVKDRRPFFLYLSHYAVHAPFQSDPRFAKNYQGSGKRAPAQAFATMVEGADKSLGDVLDCLEALGVAENTLVFFLGDNGSDAPLGGPHEVASSAPLRGKKGSHYEGGVRVPFLAAWAKSDPQNKNQQRLPIAAGVLQTQQAAIYDLYPTILALADIPSPEGHVIDGQRLDNLLTGKPDRNREETFLMHYPHSPHRSNYFTSYRSGDWKVIYHYFPNRKSPRKNSKKRSEITRYQLFNLRDDPFESKNLAETAPDQLQRMMRKMVEELEKCDALYPVEDADPSSDLKPTIPE